MQLKNRPIRATSAQYGIWLAQQSDRSDLGYLTAEVIELEGALDMAALTVCVEAVLDHADSLHMHFAWADGALWQCRKEPSTQLALIDVSAEDEPEYVARCWMKSSMSKSSGLTSDSLYRTALLRLSPTKHWWYLQVHHIALDGFGYGLLQQTVAARYNALVRNARLPDLPDWQMDRVVEAETHYRHSGNFDVDRAFWRTYTRHIPAPLLLTPEHDVADEALQETIVVDDIRLATFREAAGRAGVDWNAWSYVLSGFGWHGRENSETSRSGCL